MSDLQALKMGFSSPIQISYYNVHPYLMKVCLKEVSILKDEPEIAHTWTNVVYCFKQTVKNMTQLTLIQLVYYSIAKKIE